MPSDARLVPTPGFTPDIGVLVSMLEFTRKTTLDAVRGLPPAQLDWSSGPRGNSIGALLAHVAAVEWAYGVATFDRREPTVQEKTEWRPALQLGAAARERYRGWTLDQHLALLAQVRQSSLERLAQCDDAWLDQEFTLIEGTLVNFRWAWFHVFEDELSHRGQILLIRNHLLPASPAPAS